MKHEGSHAISLSVQGLALTSLLTLALALPTPAVAEDKGKLDGIVSFGKVLGNTFKSKERREQEWAMAMQAMDEQSPVAPPGSYYAERLADLTSNMQVVNGKRLNFLVYENPQVNAFAVATGDVRVYSGLMDMLSDDELLFVIGHEIGHVMEGHSHAGASRRNMQEMVTMLAKHKMEDEQQQKAVAVSTVLVGRSFNRKQEKEADLFGLSILEYNQRPLYAGVTAMHRLAAANGTSSDLVQQLLSTHPDPLTRARILRDKLPESELPEEELDQGITIKKFGSD